MDENPKEYCEMVAVLAKPGLDIVSDMTENKAHLWHMATGISGEVGELFHAFMEANQLYATLDVLNVVEEFGDIEFYMEGYRQGLCWGRAQTAAFIIGDVPYSDAIQQLVVRAANVLDATKKYVIYSKELDVDYIAEQFGAIESLLESLRVVVGISRDGVLDENKHKLGLRYHGGNYSDRHAQERADKNGEES